jgi:hypothetical protein
MAIEKNEARARTLQQVCVVLADTQALQFQGPL